MRGYTGSFLAVQKDGSRLHDMADNPNMASAILEGQNETNES